MAIDNINTKVTVDEVKELYKRMQECEEEYKDKSFANVIVETFKDEDPWKLELADVFLKALIGYSEEKIGEDYKKGEE